MTQPLVIAEQGNFFVTGRYVESAESGGHRMAGQMYVQFQVPHERRVAYPIVMVSGMGQTGACYWGTPDGRRGWADHFVRQGYATYVVDHPGRGRSGHHEEAHGPTRAAAAEELARRFTAADPEHPELSPAARHTQWPGAGVPGDPVFDQFYASQVPAIPDRALAEELACRALGVLLERIGPAILLVHSQAGTFAWRVADAQPRLLRAIVAVEPNGGPFHDPAANGTGGQADVPARPWGITVGPMTYEPAAAGPSDLAYHQERFAQGPGLTRCWLQQEPARRLSQLSGIPIAIVTGDASFRTGVDHCTSQFLAQAGVPNDHLRLAEFGVTGNGHLMMLEQNSAQIAAIIDRWIGEHVT